MINTVYENMPTTIKAFVRENEDDSYTIVLNSRYDRETLVKSYEHELKHITNNDMEKESADAVEMERHNE